MTTISEPRGFSTATAVASNDVSNSGGARHQGQSGTTDENEADLRGDPKCDVFMSGGGHLVRWVSAAG